MRAGRRATVFYLLGAVVFPSLGAGMGSLSAAYFHVTPQHGALAGAGVVSVLCLGVVGVRALHDTRRMGVLRRCQSLIEDGWTAHAMGEVVKAEGDLKEALDLARKRLGGLDRMTLTAVHSLANLYRVRGQWGEADAYYNAALPVYQRKIPQDHPARANLAYHLALNCEGKQQYAQALMHAEAALRYWSRIAGENSPEAADMLVLVGRHCLYQNLDERALDSFQDALRIQSGLLGSDHPTVLATMSSLSRVNLKLKRYQEAEKLLNSLLIELSKGELGGELSNPLALAEAHLDMAFIRTEQSLLKDAEPHLIKGLQLLQHQVGPVERLLHRILEGYKRLTRGNLEIGDELSSVINLVALFFGQRERIRQLLEQFPTWVRAHDNTGWGPLQWATFLGRDDLVRWLIGKGADPNHCQPGVMTPLHVACAWGRRESLLEILDSGADLKERGPYGWTAVFWCAQSGRSQLLELLIKRGAEVNLRDDKGRTPLHVAAIAGHLNAVASLIGAGAAVNAKDRDRNRTALHWAAVRGHLAVCECLVFNGADMRLPDADEMTALDLAQQGRYRLLTRILKRHLQAGLGKGGSTRRKHGMLDA